MPDVKPFAMTSASQFLPPPPPALDSAQYAAELNQVESLGAVNSTTRTSDQTAYAHFWADVQGWTFTPPGHWNQIAQDAAMSSHLGLEQETRLFALLDVALADAGISAWDAKNVYNRWRPVTAIRQADTDGNPLTTADPTWTPLWVTPPFQSYTSGHSTFSGAAQVVLESFFGTHYAFTDTGDPTQHLAPRHFTSFAQAADEAGMSRVVGGIHFMSDNLAGLAEGRAVGHWVLATVMQ
jgi:membrane-associated phospholipid phosphatase